MVLAKVEARKTVRAFLAILENDGSGEDMLAATLDAEEALARFREWLESQ